MVILNLETEITDHIYLIDTMQFGISRITSCFLFWDGTQGILMDTGTSDNVSEVLQTIKKFGISLKKISMIIPTHYHFDHMGGATKLWKRMQKKNPDFKIVVPETIYQKLENADDHITGARTTFGEFVGTMQPAGKDAYIFQEYDQQMNLELGEYSIELHHTPGHSPDHCSPVVRRGKEIHFVFSGEACGSIFNSTQLLSVPTSMPPHFIYDQYMTSLQFFKNNQIPTIGFCHFGAIQEEMAVQAFVNEHMAFMQRYYHRIKELYSEQPSTRHVIENTDEFWEGRFDERLTSGKMAQDFLMRLRLALTYGPLVSLGFKQPKYERKEE